MKQSLHFIAVPLWIAAVSLSAIAPAIAQPEGNTIQAFDPPGSGAPPETHGAGSRSGQQCPQQQAPMRSLMPINRGLTFSDRPVVSIAMPDATPENSAIRQAVLTFRNEQEQIHAQTTLPVVIKQGIARLQLPSSTPPLAMGQSYRWSVVMICGETVQPDDPILSGWLQRLPKKLQMARTSK
jgi:hypothetical protein